MISYLLAQKHRMNDEQRNFVERTSKIPESQLQKKEREWQSLLYMWLHINDGSVSKRKFPSSSQNKMLTIVPNRNRMGKWKNNALKKKQSS